MIKLGTNEGPITVDWEARGRKLVSVTIHGARGSVADLAAVMVACKRVTGRKLTVVEIESLGYWVLDQKQGMEMWLAWEPVGRRG